MPKPDAPPELYVVVVPFLADGSDLYAAGDVIHPDDPYLKANPERFAPFKFRHPVKARVVLAKPEVRA